VYVEDNDNLAREFYLYSLKNNIKLTTILLLINLIESCDGDDRERERERIS
jgi:hypothetical protein